MVRHKVRWLFVKLEYDDGVTPSRKDIARTIQEHFVQCWGDAASGWAADTQVRFFDPRTRHLLIRVAKRHYKKARAALTLLHRVGHDGRPLPVVALHVVSVHGSGRLAKRASIERIRAIYKRRIWIVRDRPHDVKMACAELEDTLQILHGLDY